MSVTFVCVKCSARLRSADGTTGKKTRCIACNEVNLIPGPIDDVEVVSLPEPARNAATIQVRERPLKAQVRATESPRSATIEDPASCPTCGQANPRNALRCRNCNRLFVSRFQARAEPDPSIGKPIRRDQLPQGPWFPDHTPRLTTVDKVATFILPDICFLVGIVRAVRGNPTGGLMMGYSVLFFFVRLIVGLILIFLLSGPK